MFDGLLGIVGNIHRGSHFCYFPPEYRVWFLGAVNLFISRLPWSCHGLVLGFVRHMYFTWYLGHDLSRISSESWGFSTIHSGWVWISLPDAVQALKSWLSCSLLDYPELHSEHLSLGVTAKDFRDFYIDFWGSLLCSSLFSGTLFPKPPALSVPNCWLFSLFTQTTPVWRPSLILS